MDIGQKGRRIRSGTALARRSNRTASMVGECDWSALRRRPSNRFDCRACLRDGCLAARSHSTAPIPVGLRAFVHSSGVAGAAGSDRGENASRAFRRCRAAERQLVHASASRVARSSDLLICATEPAAARERGASGQYGAVEAARRTGVASRGSSSVQRKSRQWKRRNGTAVRCRAKRCVPRCGDASRPVRRTRRARIHCASAHDASNR